MISFLIWSDKASHLHALDVPGSTASPIASSSALPKSSDAFSEPPEALPAVSSAPVSAAFLCFGSGHAPGGSLPRRPSPRARAAVARSEHPFGLTIHRCTSGRGAGSARASGPGGESSEAACSGDPSGSGDVRPLFCSLASPPKPVAFAPSMATLVGEVRPARARQLGRLLLSGPVEINGCKGRHDWSAD